MAVESNASSGLLATVKSFLTPGMVEQMTRHLDESPDRVHAGVQTAVPALLAGLVQKGSSESGARELLRIIEEMGFDQVSDPRALLERVDESSPMQGEGMLSNLFGSRLDGIADLISRKSGLRSTSSHSLLGFLAPIVFGVLGMHSRGMSPASLVSLLSQQKDSIFSSLPQGFAQASKSRESLSGRLGHMEQVSGDQGTPGLSRWVLPLVILAVLVAGVLWMNRVQERHEAMVTSQETMGTMGASRGEALNELTPDQVSAVQRALSSRGYDVPLDGKVDGATLDALRDFQRKNGIEATAMMDSETTRQLSLPSDFLERL